MRFATDSGVSRIVGRAQHIWAELDYAQRRLFEIQTGIPTRERGAHPRLHGSIEELECLWAVGECERVGEQR
jgi:hypothetical protein